MKLVNVLIVEDEPIIAQDLSYTLKDLGYNPVGIAYDSDDAIEALANEKIDLVLLDINIDGPKDGVDIAEIINASHHLPFIFLTSYSDAETIERVKKTKPVGYLVKPIDEKDLHTTIEIGLNNFQEKINMNEIINQEFNDILFIKDHNSLVKIEISDILYAEASDNYTLVHTDKKKFIISSTLKAIEGRLANWKFIRVHRSFLINPYKIDSISSSFVMVGSHKIPISRRLKEDFMDKINTI
jgi:DNA-binding LytR/AlgR family response regulator